MRIKQIGIMGSAADLGYKLEIEKIAFELGKQVAINDYVLVYGAEKDTDSLSAVASRGSKSQGGLVTGITYGNTPNIWGDMLDFTDVIINTGMQRGGGREFVLVSSCDAIIVIGGGSGTLNEMAIAYQKKIPIVVIEGTGGWADKLKNQYLDERFKLDPTRFICKGVKNPKEAIDYLKYLQSSS